jgi:hypothetical protein
MADDPLEPREFTRAWQVRWLDSQEMKIYRGLPQGLHHNVPHRVEPGALFHVRIAVDREKAQNALTSPLLAKAILESAKLYEAKIRWHITLFLLMPDHLHALLSSGRDGSMGAVIRDWMRFHTRKNGVPSTVSL